MPGWGVGGTSLVRWDPMSSAGREVRPGLGSRTDDLSCDVKQGAQAGGWTEERHQASADPRGSRPG